jgi:hypothetical protein
MGDAIVTMAWLGTRRQDWLAWPANIFDTQFLAWDTEKTNAPVTIPWAVVPALRQRIEAAKARHQSAAIRATTFSSTMWAIGHGATCGSITPSMPFGLNWPNGTRAFRRYTP